MGIEIENLGNEVVVANGLGKGFVHDFLLAEWGAVLALAKRLKRLYVYIGSEGLALCHYASRSAL